MRFDIITIFPKIFDPYFNESLLRRAQRKKLLEFRVHDLRSFADPKDPHWSVDDRIYGGGPGMLLKVEPLYRVVRSLVLENPQIFSKKILYKVCIEEGRRKGSRVCHILEKRNRKARAKIFMLDPRGKIFDQHMAQKFSKLDQIILLSGRYEGFDARVEKFADEKISIGKFILSGGEVAAMTLIEAISRMIPGVVGNEKSLEDETYNELLSKGILEGPHYTRPERFSPAKGVHWAVPKVLLSGHHGKIHAWKQKKHRS